MKENGVVELLLVEDNPHDLELTLRALQKANVANRVEIARDGVEALDYVFAEGRHAKRRVTDTPRLILLDLKLPKIDGLEVLKRIKGDARTRSIPIVVLTSSKEQRDVIESYKLGVNSYIVKPVTFEALVDILQTLEKYWFEIVELPPKKD